jgi:hypothetical protein
MERGLMDKIIFNGNNSNLLIKSLSESNVQNLKLNNLLDYGLK